jgi:hypothetical protein
MMKRIHIWVDEDLHRQLKSLAAMQRATLKGFLTGLIQQAVKEGGKKA